MITTELEKICSLLRGFNDSDYFDVKFAAKNHDGIWKLEVVRVVDGKEEGGPVENNESENA